MRRVQKLKVESNGPSRGVSSGLYFQFLQQGETLATAQGSVLIWIFVVFFLVWNVQTRSVGWNKPNPTFLGTPYQAIKRLIPDLFENVFKFNITIDEKYEFFQVFPFERLFFCDFNGSHNRMTFAGRDQVLSAYLASLVRASMASKHDKNTVQCERQIGRIYDIKLDMETQRSAFRYPDPNRTPVFYSYPLPQVDFLQPDALFRSFGSYPCGLSLLFNGVQCTDSNNGAPNGNSDQGPVRYKGRNELFAPIRLIHLAIGAVLFFLEAWPRRDDILSASRSRFWSFVGKGFTVTLIGLGLICVFWDRLQDASDQQSDDEPRFHSSNTVARNPD